MRFSELVSIAGFVNFTCYIWRDGKFEQWEPTHYGHGIHRFDQTGNQLKEMNAPVLDMRVHNIMPTAYNFMNVYLY